MNLHPSCRNLLSAVFSILALVISTLALSGTATAASAQPEYAQVNVGSMRILGCPSSSPIAAEDCPHILEVYHFVLDHNWSPPPGLKGGKPYLNTNGKLPPGDYREYDIYPAPAGGGRGPKRLVMDKNDPVGNSWYTADHYVGFVSFYDVVEG
jgi:guanyl-specific ribonuclease Sa